MSQRFSRFPLLALLALAACAGTERPPSVPAGDIAADAEACREIARRDVPLRSAQTTYLLDGPALRYESCMSGRGHADFPAY